MFVKDIQDCRKQIDAIDQKIASLFEERMRVAKDIANYKKENHLPIFDESREKAMLEKELDYIHDPALKAHYANYLKSLFTISKNYQMETSKEEKDIQVNVLPSYLVRFLPLEEASSFFNLKRKVLLLSDFGVPFAYLDSIQKQGNEIYSFIIPQGEASKNIDNYQALLSFMLKNKFTRKDCLLSLGGGVVGDLGGFVASTYMRGIDFYNVPTTLLSMIDSSIGGKTAIDFGNYKNSVGTFHQPKGVLIDPNLLKSLDARQVASGMGEAIKIAMLLDRDLFEKIEAHQIELPQIIHRCIELKKKTVEKDEKEGNLRKILNFGHTIGHAIEIQNEGKLFHGECVAIGMIPFTKEKERLRKLLLSYHLPTQADFDLEKAKEAILHDKKSSADGIDIIKVETIGSYAIEKMSVESIMEELKKGDILCPMSLARI